jgi:hypothetical protein
MKKEKKRTIMMRKSRFPPYALGLERNECMFLEIKETRFMIRVA